MRRHTRVLLLVLATAMAAHACAPGAGSSADATPIAVEIEDLRQDLRAIVMLQAEGDDGVATVLRALRELDRSIARFREPETVDDARTEWEAVSQAVSGVVVDDLRDPFIEIAHATDRARARLAVLQQRVDDVWKVEYLDAEDDVLVVLRDYAEVSDELARELITFWPYYEDVRDRTATFVEQRGYYRTAQEAADAYELAIQPLLTQLERAQERIRSAMDRREEAATHVNDAAEAARRTWEARRDATPPP